MMIGYRRIGKVLKFYLEDCTVYHYVCLGYKRIKPDRILKYRGKRNISITKISEGRFAELEDKMEWIEIK